MRQKQLPEDEGRGEGDEPAAPRVLELRRIDADGWREWRRARRAALADAPTAFSSTLGEWSGEGDTEARWRARLEGVALNVMAEAGGLVAGMVSGAHEEGEDDAELLSLWVSPEHRGLGVGDALVDAVLDWARDRQFARVSLAVRTANRHATALYERHGFRDLGAIEAGEGAGGDRCVNERRMAVELAVP